MIEKLKLTKPFLGDYPVSFSFGEVPKGKRLRGKFREWGLKGHNGIDYLLPEGTAVLACDLGKVVMAGDYKDGYGVLVKLAHSWGESLYAHLKEVSVKAGQKVDRGQIIGYSGGTGFVTKPHLHFAIRIKPFDKKDDYFGWSDPKPYLS